MSKRRGLELQLKVRTIAKETREGQVLTFGFRLGFLHFFLMVGLPDKDTVNPLAYIKCTMAPNDDWEVFHNHG